MRYTFQLKHISDDEYTLDRTYITGKLVFCRNGEPLDLHIGSNFYLIPRRDGEMSTIQVISEFFDTKLRIDGQEWWLTRKLDNIEFLYAAGGMVVLSRIGGLGIILGFFLTVYNVYTLKTEPNAKKAGIKVAINSVVAIASYYFIASVLVEILLR